MGNSCRGSGSKPCCSACESVEREDLKLQMVSSLGKGEEGEVTRPLSKKGKRTRSTDFDDASTFGQKRCEIHCPEGHTMRAHIVTEMFMTCHRNTCCDRCERDIEKDGASYQCVQCPDHYTICVECAREVLGFHPCEDRGVPIVDVMPGDIFLCGPNKFGIHHVVLARGELQPAEPEYYDILGTEPGMELYSCETIESTQGDIGETTWWFPTRTFYQRNPSTGDIVLVADHPPDSDVVSAATEPVPMKILLHPLRGESGQEELDLEAFEEVVQEAAEESRKYGKRTAVKSFLESFAHKGTIDSADYPTAEKREQLMEKIRKTWDARPICASVAIQCWQKYFDATCEEPEEAAQWILQVMPHWCDKSTPSLMVTTLTQHSWVLLDNFDA
mmetsp:Transcript_15855/g.50745  ORF Transcript_15855/g.50745 Transcript_15855/m.50745 type:complete len:388 (-) Transcript_15855:195-1358(-)